MRPPVSAKKGTRYASPRNPGTPDALKNAYVCRLSRTGAEELTKAHTQPRSSATGPIVAMSGFPCLRTYGPRCIIRTPLVFETWLPAESFPLPSDRPSMPGGLLGQISVGQRPTPSGSHKKSAQPPQPLHRLGHSRERPPHVPVRSPPLDLRGRVDLPGARPPTAHAIEVLEVVEEPAGDPDAHLPLAEVPEGLQRPAGLRWLGRGPHPGRDLGSTRPLRGSSGAAAGPARGRAGPRSRATGRSSGRRESAAPRQCTPPG
jgi:hypothetical protein